MQITPAKSRGIKEEKKCLTHYYYITIPYKINYTVFKFVGFFMNSYIDNLYYILIMK